ncbi:hypothetical protein OUZ56_011579 [Daphnia magna]|uniref:Uncharacterized protein n=1 Tax=Daphnia magna TaxID=35525 RepID=A0ABQ9Z0I9_9CRUS|nr:hypothetical protein OUZ56_011579 [Daphnia magna]
MAENPLPSAASVKEKLKKFREREEKCAVNLRLIRQDLLNARTAVIDVVLAHQKVMVKLDHELEENAKDLKNVHVHIHSEKEVLLSSFVGSLLRKEPEKAASKPVSQPDVPRFVAPKHTPSNLCFLRTQLGKPGMWACGRKVSEYEDFMLMTNRERLELLFAQHRCFGCFLPLSVAGHLKLADCPHPRYLWKGGPAVTYSTALTGRIGPEGLAV